MLLSQLFFFRFFHRSAGRLFVQFTVWMCVCVENIICSWPSCCRLLFHRHSTRYNIYRVRRGVELPLFCHAQKWLLLLLLLREQSEIFNDTILNDRSRRARSLASALADQPPPPPPPPCIGSRYIVFLLSPHTMPVAANATLRLCCRCRWLSDVGGYLLMLNF